MCLFRQLIAVEVVLYRRRKRLKQPQIRPKSHLRRKILLSKINLPLVSCQDLIVN